MQLLLPLLAGIQAPSSSTAELELRPAQHQEVGPFLDSSVLAGVQRVSWGNTGLAIGLGLSSLNSSRPLCLPPNLEDLNVWCSCHWAGVAVTWKTGDLAVQRRGLH